MKKIITLSILTSSLVLASGYRLPESSINSTALSAAYLANANGADSAYYNPANMVFNENINQIEGAVTYINLSKIKYIDNTDPTRSSNSKEENLFAPSIFMSSADISGFRYGISFVVPGGLSKRWNSPYAKAYAQEFTLKIVELNPTIAYKINDQFAIGGGLRAVYSEGIVKSDGTSAGKPIIREMEGDTLAYGYNLALTYKPISKLSIGATYRSNVNLNEKGNAKLSLSGVKYYDGGANVQVPLPAVAAIGIAYDFGKTVVELEYDRTFWSKYKTLDFDYKSTIPLAILKGAFDDPKAREWKDTDAIRLGVTHQLNSNITIMAAVATDENPAPEKNIGFELPDSDAMLFSGGAIFKISDKVSLGMSVLYDAKDERKVTTEDKSIDGKFKDASATLVTVGASYKF